jgi:S-adenosylmethionine synthetase
MKQRKPYTTYTKEFKQEAVRLMETLDRPAAEIARELGIRRKATKKKKGVGDKCFLFSFVTDPFFLLSNMMFIYSITRHNTKWRKEQ